MKRIFIAVLMLISVNVFGQSPSGVDKTLTKPATPMTAIEYQYKYLKVDSGLSIAGKTFIYDSLFLKGKAYLNQTLVDKDLPERNGYYKVKSVAYKGGTSGLRQEITVDYLIRNLTDAEIKTYG